MKKSGKELLQLSWTYRMELRAVDACIAEAFRQADIDCTARQAMVLWLIQAKKSVSQTDLAVITEIDRSTLSDVVRRLVDKGLVKRHRNPNDDRAYVVSLTRDGQALLRQAMKVKADY